MVPLLRSWTTALLTLVGASGVLTPLHAQTFHVFVGTYTGKKSQGIYRLEFDAGTGKLGPAELAAKTTSPSFLAVHPSGSFLVCVNEVGSFAGKKGGGIGAYALDPGTGKLTLLNQQSSVGGGPCHVVFDRSGRCVLAANYGGGSVVAYPLEKDGRIGDRVSFHQHQGSSLNKSRQEGPHAHSINVDGTNRFAVAADLGLDKVLIYRLDPAQGKLTPHEPAFVATPPGGGPRHLAFHPSNRFAYVCNELTSSVSALAFDADKGVFEVLQTISTLPKGYKGKGNSTAEIVVHPSGKFVYCSNRGHDSIAMFRVGADGKLTSLGQEKTRGKTPRNFAVDPTGRFLLAANQSTDTLTVFAIDRASGTLRFTDQTVEVPSPVCVRFAGKK